MLKPPRILAALGLGLAIVLALPVAAGLVRLLGGGAGAPPLPGLADATAVSLASATVATGLAALGGVPLGYRLARRPGPTVAVLGTVVQLPLALPPLASGVLLLFALSDAGVLGRWTDSFAAIVLAELFVAAPFAAIGARSAFAALDPAIEDAARTLGLGPGAVFTRIALPAQWRPIAAALALTWLRGFGEFGATAMVAYHPYSLPVFTYVAFGAGGLPAMLPVLLPTLAAAVAVAALASLLARDAAPGGAVPERIPPPFRLDAARERPAAHGQVAAPAERLTVSARAALGGFTLAFEWNTNARRLAILGASGSGKSLTLRVLAGIAHAPATRITLGERRLDRLPAEQRGVGYVPQDYGLAPHLTVQQQLRLAPDHDPARIAALVERLDLATLLDRKPRALSRGQAGRVALARALARREPSLLLLDEPFAALDTPLRRAGQALLGALQRDTDALTVLVTHDPEEAQLLADELLLLDDGRVLQAGPAAAVWRRPVDARAAFLMGARFAARGNVAPDGASISVGAGTTVAVGPDLPPPGTAIGWSIAHGAARASDTGTLAARLLGAGPVVNGERVLRVALGNAVLEAVGSPERARFVAIAPEAVQVWPV